MAVAVNTNPTPIPNPGPTNMGFNTWQDFLIEYFKVSRRRSVHEPRLAGRDPNEKILGGTSDSIDIGELSYGQIYALYKRFLLLFRELEANSKLPPELEALFGDKADPTKPFYRFEPNNTTTAQIIRFMDVLKTSSGPIASHVQNELFDENYTYDKFILDYDKRDFSEQFISKLRNVLSYVQNTMQLRARYLKKDTIFKNFSQGKEIDQILSGLKEGSISGRKILLFRLHHRTILNFLYNNDKFKETFAKTKGGEQITNILDDVRNNPDFSFDKVPYVPGSTEKHTIPRRVIKWADKTWKDHFGKPGDLASWQIFTTQDGEKITKAIREENLGPTNGLPAIIAASDQIKAHLSGDAEKAWDIFISIMRHIKIKMPVALAGACKNGGQMLAVVAEVIKHCVAMGKVKEAKAILEVLAVHSYGLTTSHTHKAFSEVHSNMFEGIEGMDKGYGRAIGWMIDKSIDIAMLLIFWSIQMGWNKMKQGGRKFKGKTDLIKEVLNTFDPTKPLELYQERYDTAKRAYTQAMRMIVAAEKNSRKNDATNKENTANGLKIQKDLAKNNLDTARLQISNFISKNPQNPVPNNLVSDLKSCRQLYKSASIILRTSQREAAAARQLIDDEVLILQALEEEKTKGVAGLDSKIKAFQRHIDWEIADKKLELKKKNTKGLTNIQREQTLDLMANWDLFTGKATSYYGWRSTRRKTGEFNTPDPVTGKTEADKLRDAWLRDRANEGIAA